MRRWPAYALFDMALALSTALVIATLLDLPPDGLLLYLVVPLVVIWTAASLVGPRYGLTVTAYFRNVVKPAFESRDEYRPQR